MNDITALAQRMNEVDPRDEFEKLFPLPVFCIRFGTGYASTSFNDWAANTHKDRWEGWKAAMASLESRTVTVKLPAEYLNADGSVNADMANTCPVVSAYREAHRAAGIQVIEGEGQ